FHRERADSRSSTSPQCTIKKAMHEPKSITGRIGAGGKRVVDSIVKGLASLHIHPNILTLIGMVINIFAMVLFAKGIFSWDGLVLIGSVLTSYTRARAESLIPACKVGFLERPERIVLLIIGSLWDRMAAALWVMAILSNWTVSQRIWYTWRELSAVERHQRVTS